MGDLIKTDSTQSVNKSFLERALSAFKRKSGLIKTASLSWAKDIVGNKIIKNVSDGTSMDVASITLQGGNFNAPGTSYQDNKALENILLPIATEALIETIREVTGVEPVKNQEILSSNITSPMNLTRNVGSDQAYGRGVDIYVQLPESDQSVKFAHISLRSKYLRRADVSEKLATLYCQRAEQLLALKMPAQKSKLQISRTL